MEHSGQDSVEYKLASKVEAAEAKLASIKTRLESGQGFGEDELRQLNLHLDGLIATAGLADAW